MNHKAKSIFTEAAIYLFMLLFLYTGTEKLFTHDRFLLTLQQSPVIPPGSAGFISWAVPVSELLIAGMLLYRPLRKTGLYLFLLIMTAFTGYLFVVVYYTSYIPCSCGGIIEKLSWKNHLVLNIGLCLLAAVCLRLTPVPPGKHSTRLSTA